MIRHTISLDSLAAVSPRSVYAYLSAQGWEQVRPYGDMGSVYASEYHNREVLVPASTEFADYAIRLNEIIATLSRVEDRDGLAILRDITLTGYDLVRVRLPEAAEDGSVPIDAGVTLLSESRKLLMAAACSALKPRDAFPRPASYRKANDYIRTVRLGQTEQGSFVISLLSPVPVSQDVENASAAQEMTVAPFARQATCKLASGLSSAEQTIDSVFSSGSDALGFKQKAQLGISANLCDALAKLLECASGSNLDISIGWSPMHSPPGCKGKAHFSASARLLLKEAARVLKESRNQR